VSPASSWRGVAGLKSRIEGASVLTSECFDIRCYNTYRVERLPSFAGQGEELDERTKLSLRHVTEAPGMFFLDRRIEGIDQ
jgi:hypothetical protein